MYHPREVVERVFNGCTFCRRSSEVVSHLMKCPTCHIASYCSKECQRKHWPTHTTLCIALKSRYSVTAKIIPLAELGETPLLNRGFHLKSTGKGPKPDRNKKFMVKIQTQHLNSHPLQLMFLYDKSHTLICCIQRSEIFNVIMECGVLEELSKFTSKQVFFWAMLAEKKDKLTIFLDHLAPYQEW